MPKEMVPLYKVGWFVKQLHERGYTTQTIADTCDIPKRRLDAAVVACNTRNTKSRMNAELARRLQLMLEVRPKTSPHQLATKLQRDQLRYAVGDLTSRGMTIKHICKMTGITSDALQQKAGNTTYETYTKFMSVYPKLIEDLQFGIGTTGAISAASAERSAKTRMLLNEQSLYPRIRGYLAEHPNASVSEIARSLHVDRASVNRIDAKYHLIPDENRPRKRRELAKKRYLKLLKTSPNITNDEAIRTLGVTQSTFFAMKRDLRAQGIIA